MKIVRIFGPADDSDEGLWSLKIDGETTNEFERICEIWQDTEEMYACCLIHLADLQVSFGFPITAEKATEEIMDEADELLELIYKLGTKQLPGMRLQQFFRPLDNRQSNLTVLQLSKGSAKTRTRWSPKLRLYAVRIGVNTFVVTGGAIKATSRMDERPHTQKQLIRLTTVKDWLKSKGIAYPEDLSHLS
jgi:hypothetical protein